MVETEVVRKKPEMVLDELDMPYEEEILRHPYSVKCWLRYIEHKIGNGGKDHVVNLIYERALKELPGSYKLWYNYLRLRRKQTKGKCITDPIYADANNAHERALVFMHKMPRIWLDYCQFLIDQCFVTRTRHAFDRALRALPITQHSRIWPKYLAFVNKHNIPETAVRVYRRYIKVEPENTEAYIDYLMEIGWLDEAASKLAFIINQDNFVSKKGKSNHQLWHELCELISKNPEEVKSLKVADIINGALRRFTDGLGQLWCSLADYYTRGSHFERARDVYEEAIQTVMTVRDFGEVFDAYAQFEESMISAKMQESEETGLDEDGEVDLELRLARFELLMDRRPLLLNSVLLRQNPHNVHEWHKRVQLYEDKPHEIINTYSEAVQTVDPMIATGKPHTLWVEFAKFYEKHGQIKETRIVFEKSLKVKYRHVEDLANVWCEYAEMEIRNNNSDEALKVLRRATSVPRKKIGTNFYDTKESVQNRVHKSIKIWCMYADMEESLGTFQSTKAVYNRIIDLRIATPQVIINFASLLEENNYFEESFKAYERGIALFKWPHVYDIWNTYLTKFIARYGGNKLERARDLFEQCLENCPEKFAKNLYLLYAKLEEDFGLSRHAMAVYERATRAVPKSEQFEIFNIYIKRAAELFGITHTRTIYEKAIEALSDEHARTICLRYADLETKLGEIDRARAIYSFGSQMCDPRIAANFWKAWHDFEVKHGNEDTFREMLRIKRSVQAQYNTQVNFMSAQILASQAISEADSKNVMEKLEEQANALAEEAAKDAPSSIVTQKSVLFVRGETNATEYEQSKNPDEIDIAEVSSEDDGDEDDIQLMQREVPEEVFGGVMRNSSAS
ncbi:pre-mRNA-splicing factor SYF1 isoform X2 [Hydra vulgaris]|uniref:Pre-mRNA-splicing factor SYF1 isoform X2 n=1 Tax=Hydra vulgaris TaxID=6087 RepID=A0ABM4CIG6_HYDVU